MAVSLPLGTPKNVVGRIIFYDIQWFIGTIPLLSKIGRAPTSFLPVISRITYSMAL